MSEPLFQLMFQRGVEVNTDPERRCYNGCHFSSEVVWPKEWMTIADPLPKDKCEALLSAMQYGHQPLSRYRIQPV